MGDFLVRLGGATVENWAAAEKVARNIIRKVQPTHASEERRRDVVNFIQRLIKNRIGAVEVFPYGSFPLKTYLPEGDIDLTIFCGNNINVENTLPKENEFILQEAKKNTVDDFVVMDVQFIDAKVKLVKCIVEDIVVDISFNQIGGLSTLCFLEQVDRMIGRDHLFKHSIILIKAWCYYESRILGAHHGLISTYSLEILVLYIFHLYHSLLDGPLSVLYKFLDCFSKFDWDTYCVSLQGRIRISSLPTINVEIPEDSDKDVLLSNDFLNYCVGTFFVASRPSDKNSHVFIMKHLNIVDPLKVINNLGRSVSKGSFYRICNAFSYGARKLAHILAQPHGHIANGLQMFFANTMARHGGGQTVTDSQSTSDLRGDYESYFKQFQYGRWCYGYGLNMQPSFNDTRAVPFGWEDMPKHRGTGAYLPNANMIQNIRRYGYRSSSEKKARNRQPSSSTRHNENASVQEEHKDCKLHKAESNIRGSNLRCPPGNGR